MQTPIPDYLNEVLAGCEQTGEGAPADYIPELAKADPKLFAVAIATPDGTVYDAGDSDVEFTIQSISKAFVYALALQDRGIDEIDKYIGLDPSGDAFNEISLEPETGRPRNPMINIGAITTHGLVGGPDVSPSERFSQIQQGLSAFAGRDLTVDEEVFNSEIATSYRNRSLAHMVRSHGLIEFDPNELVTEYTRQCALQVRTTDLAMMGATLANSGRNPVTGERVISMGVTRRVLSVMLSCGMYDAAGDWISAVGIPAKSGVAGGILGVLPGEVGLATFSPPLDEFGNSVRGVQTFQRLSSDMGLHLMSTPARGPVAVRDVDDRDGTTIMRLQGAVHFSEAEQILRAMSRIAVDDNEVVIDVTRVAELDDVGTRMVLEGIRRLTLDGHQVSVTDPDGVLEKSIA